jgi:hypothetical protein
MRSRVLSLVALLPFCTSLLTQQIQQAPVAGPVASPQPYAGGSGVRWSHTFRKAGASRARLRLSIDLGAGDQVVLKDFAGVEQWHYEGQGPGAVGATASLMDMGAGAQSLTFLSGEVLGDVVTIELRGRSGGQGVTVHEVRWQDLPATLASSTGDCDLDVVVPAGFETVAGNSSTSFPWNGTGGMRVMYAYGRSTAGFERPVRVRGVRYRPLGGAPTNAVTYDLRLDVSTGRNPAQALNATFNANHGADRVTAFNGLFTHPGSATTTAPGDFTLELAFDTPFEWDPRCGPLVLDFRRYSATASAGSAFDLTTSSLMDVGRIADTSNANATIATFLSGSTQRAGLIVDLCLEADVAPQTLARVEGNSSSSYPFSRTSPMRVQYAYDQSTIGFEGRHKISALSFRMNNGSAFAGNSYDLLMTMSTAANAVNALSPSFAANHGSDQTLVFDGVHVAAAAPAATSPGPFVLTIPLQTPFEYNPANGPLLIDMRLRTGATATPQWDGELAGASAYRLFDTSSATATSGSIQHFALAVALSAEPIPTIPEVDDSSFGSSSSSFPWNSNPQRIQYQYGPGDIATDRPLFIQHLSWRPESAGAFGPASFTCTIDLSTSAVAVGAITPAFNNNHGADRSRVFDGTFSVPFLPNNADPRKFPITVKLDQPFYYDPANGPLLVDIRMLSANGNTTALDGSFNSTTWRMAHLSNPNSNIADYPSSGNPQGFGLDLRLSGEGCNATSISYGTACTGTNGASSCVNLALPNLPAPNFGLGLRNGPANSVGILVIGLTQTNIPLAAIGAPGCSSLTPGEIGAFGVLTDPTGWAEFALPLPDGAQFAGFQFRTQWVSLDLPANALGLVFSDAQNHTTCY